LKYKIIPTARFRKDVKTAAKRGLPLCRLEEIIDQLASGTPLPERNHDHALTGTFTGYRECHILPDWLLIYRMDNEILTLLLHRTGTHSDLF